MIVQEAAYQCVQWVFTSSVVLLTDELELDVVVFVVEVEVLVLEVVFVEEEDVFVEVEEVFVVELVLVDDDELFVLEVDDAAPGWISF